MTSVLREGFDIYSATGIKFRKPKYNILSYTWGRWKIHGRTGCPALRVNGTSWDIPAIEDTHFTVKTFCKVIREVVGADVDWVWVDVGCIDQCDRKRAAVEVGRQASIFKQARGPFFWLSSRHTTELSLAIQNIQAYGIELANFVDELKAGLDIIQVIRGLDQALSYILEDPWFSSLWTLQETVLRNDAVMLSAEGEPIAWGNEPRSKYTYLIMFINHCQNIYTYLERAEKRVSGRAARWNNTTDESLADSLCKTRDKILRAGFYYLFTSNPNVQYGMARYRQTSDPEDRVYAIMQIYNLQVGKSARPDENPRLEELVDEFAIAINARSLILGQFFLHKDPPRVGKSWRITEKSTVPGPFMIFEDHNDLGTIVSGTGNGLEPLRVSGKCCKFSELLNMCTDDEVDRLHDGWGLGFEVLFDHYIKGFTTDRPIRGRKLLRVMDSRVSDELAAAMINHDDIRVLLLGNVGDSLDSRRNVGLLLYTKGQVGDENWQLAPHERLGVCLWSSPEQRHDCKPRGVAWINIERLELQ